MLRAEMIKLTTIGSTKVAFAVALGGLLLTQLIFVTLLPAIAHGTISLGDGGQAARELSAMSLQSASFQYSSLNVLGGNGSGSIGVAIIGIVALGLLVATTDYRFGGMVMTIAARPRRIPVLLAKTAATAIAAALLSVGMVVVDFAILAGSLGISRSPWLVSPLDALSTSLRGTTVVVLLALLGLAIGMLVRSQLAAFLIAIAALVIEPVASATLGILGTPALVAQLLPLGLAQTALAPLGAAGPLDPIAALCLLAGLAAVLLTFAGLALHRRDV
ncbi:hypothetical protein GCM10028798_12750 [Humibacter antri]